MGDRSSRDLAEEKPGKGDDRDETQPDADRAAGMEKLRDAVEEKKKSKLHRITDHLGAEEVIDSVLPACKAAKIEAVNKIRKITGEIRHNHNTLNDQQTILLIIGQVATLRDRVQVAVAMRIALQDFLAYEMITDTFASYSISAAIADLKAAEKEGTKWADEGDLEVGRLRRVETAISTTVHEKAHNYPELVTKQNVTLSKLCNEVPTKLRSAIDLQTIRAVIDQGDAHSKYSRYSDMALAVTNVLDQFVNATGFVSGKLNKIPEPHSQAAGHAMDIAIAAFQPVWTLSKALIDHIAKDADAGSYRKGQPLGEQFYVLDENPLAVAERLARRRAVKVNVMLAVFYDTVAGQITALCPVELVAEVPLGTLRKTILGCVEKYQAKRIEIAREFLGGKPASEIDDGLLERFEKAAVEGVRAEIEDILKTNLVALLQPLHTVTDIAERVAAEEISTAIVAVLNAPPAQPVTGEEIREHEACVREAQVRGTITGPAAPTVPDCPKATTETTPVGVRRVLSPARPVGDGGGHSWLVVLEDGRVGDLLSEPAGRFVVSSEHGVPGPLMATNPLTATYQGRKVTLASVTAVAVTAERKYPARVGHFRGFVTVDDPALVFTLETTLPVEPAAYADWHGRHVIPPGTDSGHEGYRPVAAVGAGGRAAPETREQGDDVVAGKWYRLPGSRHRYLFAPAPDGALEFATDIANTGNGSNMEAVMKGKVETMSEDDLAMLLSERFPG